MSYSCPIIRSNTLARPKEQLLSEDTVIAATMELLETEGFEKFSLRRLGKHLHVNSASLYHHFASKAQILEAVARRVLRQIELPALSEDWEQWIIQASVGYRRLLIAKPYLIPIMLSGYRPRTMATAVSEAKLTEAAIPRAYHAEIIFALETCVVGSALVSISASRLTKEPQDNGADRAGAQEFDLEHVLRTTIGVILKSMVRDTTERHRKSRTPTAAVLETVFKQNEDIKPAARKRSRSH